MFASNCCNGGGETGTNLHAYSGINNDMQHCHSNIAAGSWNLHSSYVNIHTP